MRNGLFRRYISTFAVTLIACTMLLGIALLYFSAKNFSQEKQQLLKNTSERAKTLVEENINPSPSAFEIKSSVPEGFQVIFETTGITTYITDKDGHVLLCSEGSECTHTTRVSERVLSAALRNGSYSDSWFFQGFFRRGGTYTYGEPILHDGKHVGYIFLSLPITPLFDYLSDMLITYFVSAGMMFMVAAVIVYFATRRLIGPLHEISDAAKGFGSGDFGRRVTVTGNDEIAKLAKSFNTMADSLTEFEYMRRSFVANVSHELRTPMTTIGGYIDGILDSTIPDDKEAYYLAIVSDEVKRLSRLTTSLLDITRIEEGAYSIDIKSVNVWDTIIPVMGNTEQRISDKNISITDLDVTPVYAMCDQDVLYQIVYNLIDNAVKFTPESGTITVSAVQADTAAVITVRNTGTGIKQDELGHIFERFYKTDKSRGLDRTGTGLGLYISKTLAQKMAGDVAANSRYGEYAEFVLTLKPGQKVKEQKQKPDTRQKDTKKKSSGQSSGSWFKKFGKNLNLW